MRESTQEMLFVPAKPLAEEMRPRCWEEFLGLGAIDSRLLEQLKSGSGRPPSLVLWGPPGSGKTTLAYLIGHSYSATFVPFSAVLGGVKEVRDIIKEAEGRTSSTILFVDEIHRFNRSQQDAFLPHVERGTISLIGATTENPSFCLNAALLSRMRVLVLPALDEAAMRTLLERVLAQAAVKLEESLKEPLVKAAGGDARQLINLLESLLTQRAPGEQQITEFAVRELLEGIRTLRYDREGEEHYNLASAFIKSMRGSDPDAALYWALRMIEGGEDPRFLLRRMMIFASEDIGNADPRALQVAVAASQAFDQVGLPEGKIPLAHAITYLATAPKSNRSYVALQRAVAMVERYPHAKVPMHLRNAPTRLMREMGYGEGYQYPHDNADGYVREQYLPPELGQEKLYEPKDVGYEKIIGERQRQREGERRG